MMLMVMVMMIGVHTNTKLLLLLRTLCICLCSIPSISIFSASTTPLLFLYYSSTTLHKPYFIEYDIRLQPLTDIHPESYGFPSLESYMGVVIIGHLYLRIQQDVYRYCILGFGIPLILFMSFSRLYSRSRFLHQIVASYALGLVGLIIGIHYCENVNEGFHKMDHHNHGKDAIALSISLFRITVFFFF